MDADDLALAFEGSTERSGTLKVTSFDAEFFSKLLGVIPPPPGPLPKYTISIEALAPVAWPPPWRHPLRWFRWNPLLRTRTMIRLYDATFHD